MAIDLRFRNISDSNPSRKKMRKETFFIFFLPKFFAPVFTHLTGKVAQTTFPFNNFSIGGLRTTSDLRHRPHGRTAPAKQLFFPQPKPF
jgi:hypothetical protein